jgi:lysophospholipase L1-like esterase
VPVVRFERFVALGDSFTEGLFDEVGDDGRVRGWADRVAWALAQVRADEGAAPLRYANLAVRGRLHDAVVTEQVPAALGTQPDLLTFHAGANDVLRPSTDLDDLARRYDRSVATLTRSEATVVVFTVIGRAGGTSRFADWLAHRFAAFNAQVRRSARQHGAVLVDVGAAEALQDRRMWHEDRLHLAPQGHERVAAAVLEALGSTDPSLLGGSPGWWREPLPPWRQTRRAALVSDVRWLGGHLTPWIVRRIRGVSSGDTIVCKRPQLCELIPEVG